MQETTLSRFDKFVELYYQPLFRFAARLCGRPDKAMILTHRTFYVAVDRSRDLPVPTNVRAWLFAILFRQFLEGRQRSTTVQHD